MKKEFSNKFEEKKSKIKERFKLKLEYSEKVKNNENNKVLKKFSNIKNNELPKIKILNYLNNNNIENLDSYYNNINDNNYILYNKIKKGLNIHKNENDQNAKNNANKNSPNNMHNMNLISFNENINNIYKKVTINDFNKEMNQKDYDYMMQNLDNILESNSPEKSIEDISYKNRKISPKYSFKQNNSHKNEKLVLNFKEDEYGIPEETYTNINKHKKKGNKINYMRTNSTHNNIKKQNMFKKKYYTNKSSVKKIEDNYNNSDILETEEICKNKFDNLKNKKIIYEEDLYHINKDNIKKSFDLGIKNHDFINYTNKDKLNNSSEEDESSDITIVSLESDDIKDISSDF